MGSGGGESYTRPASGSSSRGVGSGPDACQRISEEVRVSSPDPSVLITLRSGDCLSVESTNGQPPISVFTSDRRRLGSIVPASMETLLMCMEGGHHYVATIRTINGGICVVQVTAAR